MHEHEQQWLIIDQHCLRSFMIKILWVATQEQSWSCDWHSVIIIAS
jgi:hypothetical protein